MRAAPLMDLAGDDFLADAGLAGDQDLGVGARGALDLGLESANGLASPDELHFRTGCKRHETTSSMADVTSDEVCGCAADVPENRRDADILQVLDYSVNHCVVVRTMVS